MKAHLSNEKFSNSWINKLEDASALQHAALQNKDAAWEKLDARLHKKSQQNKFAWYWLAAASVLLVTLISLFTTHKATPDITQHNTVINDTKISVAKEDKPTKKVADEKAVLHTRVQLQKNIVIKSYDRKSAAANTPVITPLVINNNQDVDNQPIIVPAIIDTTATAATLIITPQKKLKVVHINELGEPVEFSADAARSTDLHIFQLKLAQQEIYNASSIAANKNSVVHFLTR